MLRTMTAAALVAASFIAMPAQAGCWIPSNGDAQDWNTYSNCAEQERRSQWQDWRIQQQEQRLRQLEQNQTPWGYGRPTY